MTNNLIDLVKKNLLSVKSFFPIGDLEEKKYYDEIIDTLLISLCDISKKEIYGLNAMETMLLRKNLGVFDNGISQKQNRICEFVNLSSYVVRETLSKAYNNIHFVVYKTNLLSIDRGSDIELSNPIQNLNLSFNSFFNLHRLGIKTIEDLICCGKFKIFVLFPDMYREIIETVENNGFTFRKESIEERREIASGLDVCRLGLSGLTYSALRGSEIKNVSQLISLNRSDLLKIRNMNLFGVEEIINKMNELGFSMGDDNRLEQVDQPIDLSNIEKIDSGSVDKSLLDKYKVLLLRRKELLQKLSRLDAEIMTLSEDIFINQPSEIKEKTKK